MADCFSPQVPRTERVFHPNSSLVTREFGAQLDEDRAAAALTAFPTA